MSYAVLCSGGAALGAVQVHQRSLRTGLPRQSNGPSVVAAELSNPHCERPEIGIAFAQSSFACA